MRIVAPHVSPRFGMTHVLSSALNQQLRREAGMDTPITSQADLDALGKRVLEWLRREIPADPFLQLHYQKLWDGRGFVVTNHLTNDLATFQEYRQTTGEPLIASCFLTKHAEDARINWAQTEAEEKASE